MEGELLYQALTQGRTTTSFAPRGWRCCFSAEHSAYYYVNEATGISSWTLPTEADAPPAKKQKTETGLVAGYDSYSDEEVGKEQAGAYNSYFDPSAATTADAQEDGKWQAPFAARPSSVFVRGLPFPDSSEASEEGLEKALSTFFSSKVSVRRSRERGNTATLTFDSPEEADEAIRRSGNLFKGRPLHVRPSYRKQTFFIEQPDKAYLRGVPPDMGEDEIAALFSNCGKVEHVYIFPKKEGDVSGSRCTASVQFQSEQSAKQAISRQFIDVPAPNDDEHAREGTYRIQIFPSRRRERDGETAADCRKKHRTPGVSKRPRHKSERWYDDW